MNICVNIKTQQAKDVKIPAIATKALGVFERRRKSVMITHAASGENKDIQAKRGFTILSPLNRRREWSKKRGT